MRFYCSLHFVILLVVSIQSNTLKNKMDRDQKIVTGSLTHLTLVSMYPLEALAQGQVVSDRVPPSTGSLSIVGEVVNNPLINTFHREPLLRRVFYCHEDETAKRVRRFGRGGRQLLDRNRI